MKIGWRMTDKNILELQFFMGFEFIGMCVKNGRKLELKGLVIYRLMFSGI
jgi:hypothetical protein